MSSTSHGKKQRDLRWDGLPREIRLLITQHLIQEGSPLAPFATTDAITAPNFRAMIQRTRGLFGYIWFCLELDEYDCTACAPPLGASTSDDFTEGCEISVTDKCPITASFQYLFSVLGEWEPRGDLTLDISLYSPSDSEHWFPCLTFVPPPPPPPHPPNVPIDHAIEKANCSRHLAPPPLALRKLDRPHDSDQEELGWWDQLPLVPAVTTLILRQQSRRRWKPHLFESIQRSNKSLRKLVVSENFIQQYPANIPSYITDASHFFAIRSERAWPKLKSLTLTAKIRTPDKVDSTGIRALGSTALFRYQVFRNKGEAVLTWREARWSWPWNQLLNVVVKWLDGAINRSHGDTIQHLELSSQVIRPVSLQHIQVEQNALEGVAIFES
ncbi:hypothetical protein BDP55DRAFT_699931 [Colletotrichum godetiae]|uniref:DUF6546 domain-containing protein n=1 Tax=Colletotrichum godetiae TaxID=1209918 RepID=A0AAJ0F5K5_9PEZI|nr:uncharacterized protein BDP55DRAFT_699931 [Colletotrichum godetiae]KAK1701553.1 hypothetical protein BDP55DRAFT_699931 [Colletotrichum godetiae]